METASRIKIRNNLIINNKAQATIEAVLLAVVLLSAFFLCTKTMREKQFLQKFTNKSVKSINHMSEYGTWRDECKPAKGPGNATASKCHPNSIARALSSDPNP
jgi:hypothetical protein